MKDLAARRAAAGEAPAALGDALLAEARAIHAEDIAMGRAMGRAGAALLPDEATVLTHCNAGGLATGGYGTAIGVVYAARELGKRVAVYADETRPLLQGARLTAFELQSQGIEVTVIPDAAAATVLRRGGIDAVITGADRIARNGDAANKIGTYPLAVMARRHDVPFYVAAPASTFDPATARGEDIVIEERDPEEVHVLGDRRVTPHGRGRLQPRLRRDARGTGHSVHHRIGRAAAPVRGIVEGDHGVAVNGELCRRNYHEDFTGFVKQL